MKLNLPFAEWIFPRQCFICKKPLSTQSLCHACESMCHRCENPLFSTGKTDAALFYFEFALKDLIKSIKYHEKNVYLHVLLRLIKQTLHTSPLLEQIIAFSPSVITFIPTHWLNLISRKSDLPQFFAETLSHELGIPLGYLLSRKNFNSRQVLRTTRRERLQGIEGSFQLRKAKKRYDRILLVDDIVTTGATFQEGKKVLKQIGGEIRCVAIAKTP